MLHCTLWLFQSYARPGDVVDWAGEGVQGLQQEVAKRQMAVLDRTPASLELPQTMQDRQASLRCGRHALPGCQRLM